MNSSFVRGTCMEMCSSAERVMRRKEGLIHPLEKPPDKTKMIKSFSRSAAGKNLLDAKSLRPPETLLKTVNYLLTEVIKNDEVPWHVTYDFVMDRLRSVRQDMVIQNLSAKESIYIFQKIVSFYAYAAYRLLNEPIKNFDPHMNNVHLQECLKRLLCMFDECNDNLYAKNRPHFEALYVVMNLNSAVAVTRALKLPKSQKTEDVKLAILLSRNYFGNNFVKVCRLIPQFSLLLQCVIALQLPEIRRRALLVMSVAYSSKQLWFPLELLRKILLYNKIEDIRDDLVYYELKCKEAQVQFLKSDFNRSKMAVSIYMDDLSKTSTNNINLEISAVLHRAETPTQENRETFSQYK
ncbi:germinal-center associated nuclear protein isoform X1 [Dendroctonus ponderosae]|uniref:germinal-center associated nuclear protein isoform X1 n=1 Tax=Dendroctonus ponderosae TaxID=77166 RepID=UPI002034CC3A|nr:germinal-center associated nuclear protein isoform X1 [Dendroctonus ponderosae]XP_048526512.1 germinal-center associated nuclear protein isoform X1 [Dendroctonus ponderosae]